MPVCVLRELDEGDDEPKVVLRLEDEADRQVAAGDADEQVDEVNPLAARAVVVHQLRPVLVGRLLGPLGGRGREPVDHEGDDERQQVGDGDPDHQAEERPGEDHQLAARREDVDADEQDAERQRDRHCQPRAVAEELRRAADEVPADGGHQQDEQRSQDVQDHAATPPPRGVK
jgi:hypothetical protein